MRARFFECRILENTRDALQIAALARKRRNRCAESCVKKSAAAKVAPEGFANRRNRGAYPSAANGTVFMRRLARNIARLRQAALPIIMRG
jgi:hypothetical protein